MSDTTSSKPSTDGYDTTPQPTASSQNLGDDVKPPSGVIVTGFNDSRMYQQERADSFSEKPFEQGRVNLPTPVQEQSHEGGHDERVFSSMNPNHTLDLRTPTLLSLPVQLSANGPSVSGDIEQQSDRNATSLDTPSNKSDHELLLSSNSAHLERPKRSKICLIRVAMVVVVLLVVILIALSVLIASFLRSKNSMHLEEIGSIYHSSSSLVTIPPSVPSITLTLSNPSTTVTVYTADTTPTTSVDTLTDMKIPSLIGPSRYNYNYNGADRPIYLLKGSVITYTVGVIGSSACPAQLFLFNNRTIYNKFRGDDTFSKFTDRSPCLPTGSTHWSFNITTPSVYYVAVAVGDGVTIASNVSVYRVYYNTTGLHSPNDCNQLSVNTPTCHHSSGLSRFTCSGPDRYILLETSRNVDIEYSYDTPMMNGCYRISFLTLSILALVLLLLCVALAIGTCSYRKQQKNTDSKTLN